MIVRRNIFEKYNDYQFSIPLNEKDRPLVSVGQNLKEGDNLYILKKNNVKDSLYVPKEIGCDLRKVSEYITCINGEYVQEGDVLAEKIGNGGLFLNKLVSPSSGLVDLSRLNTGFLDILGEETESLVKSQFEGKILDVSPLDGINISTSAQAFDLIAISKPNENIKGLQKYYTGELTVLGQDNELLFQGDDICYQNKIVFVGKHLHPNLLKDLFEKGASFVLTCSMDYSDFREQKLPVGVINGFGNIHSSDKLVKELYKYNGSYIVIDWDEIQAFLLLKDRTKKIDPGIFVKNFVGNLVMSKSVANYGMLGTIILVQEGGEYVTVEWEKGSSTVINIALLEFVSL